MGPTEKEMVGWHHWLNGHELGQTLGDRDREAGHAAVHGAQRVGHYLVTEQQQKGPPENRQTQRYARQKDTRNGRNVTWLGRVTRI